MLTKECKECKQNKFCILDIDSQILLIVDVFFDAVAVT